MATIEFIDRQTKEETPHHVVSSLAAAIGDGVAVVGAINEGHDAGEHYVIFSTDGEFETTAQGPWLVTSVTTDFDPSPTARKALRTDGDYMEIGAWHGRER